MKLLFFNTTILVIRMAFWAARFYAVNTSLHVNYVRNTLKMIWVYTRRYTAKMINFCSARYWAYLRFVCKSVTIGVTFQCADNSIPVSVYTSCPKPAFSKVRAMRRNWPIFVYFRPESDQNRSLIVDRCVHISSFDAAEVMNGARILHKVWSTAPVNLACHAA